MFKVTEEVYGFKYMYSQDDGKSHLMVIRTPSMGYESYCRAKSIVWTPSHGTHTTCRNCKNVKAEYVSSDSETSEES